MRVAACSIAVASRVACGPAISPLPSRGGAAWTEVQSPHFTVWTDTSVERARALVRDLERRRQVLLAAMNRPDNRGRAFVIGYRSQREVQEYTGPGFLGFAWDVDNPTGQPGMMFHAEAPDAILVINHALTHLISHGVVRHPPRWLAEGIAGYFETAELDDSGTSVRLGLAPRSTRLLARSMRGAADLVLGCKGACVDSAYYATSWLLFAYLLNEHFDRLSRYLQRVNELPKADHAAAWREVFPDLPPEALDRILPAWLRVGDAAMPRVRVTLRDQPATTRSLGDADVLAARSMLELGGHDEAAARRDAEAALAIDRTHLLALLIQAELAHSVSPDLGWKVTAAHRDDWRAWWLLERALRGTPEADTARARKCALSEDTAPGCDRPDGAPAPGGAASK